MSSPKKLRIAIPRTLMQRLDSCGDGDTSKLELICERLMGVRMSFN